MQCVNVMRLRWYIVELEYLDLLLPFGFLNDDSHRGRDRNHDARPYCPLPGYKPYPDETPPFLLNLGNLLCRASVGSRNLPVRFYAVIDLSHVSTLLDYLRGSHRGLPSPETFRAHRWCQRIIDREVDGRRRRLRGLDWLHLGLYPLRRIPDTCNT